MKHRNNMKKVTGLIIVFFALFISCILTGCAFVDSYIQSLKGELVGNSYQIWEYDNFGNRILTLKGDKIALAGDYDSTTGELVSSYVNITVDGKEWNHVGGTLVFAQNNADMITDFQIPENIESTSGSTGLIGVDRVINNYTNMIGKERVIVVYSQTGAPICMFQGNECYTEIPKNLPKTTKIFIDGNLVYVHRANIDIFDAELFN